MTFNVLALLCSRKEGYTASVLSHAIEGVKEVKGAEVDVVRIHDFTVRPCNSCFACIKKPGSGCTIKDDMGGSGKGELWVKTQKANAILIADPVHMWSSSAGAHAFIERLYPYLWTGDMNGMPFFYISCASNQGMQRFSAKEINRRMIPWGVRMIGPLDVHTAFLDDAFAEARKLGKELGMAAKKDAEEGRKGFADENEKFLYYQNTISPALDLYIENLTQGTNTYEKSLFPHALKSFENKEARPLLEKAAEEFKKTLELYKAGKTKEAIASIVRTGDYWTNATWIEYLKDNVVGAEQPKAYRPLPKD
ncbi:MAG: flavodoxin family protein [Candidatus Hermodarchaeota archaeon]